MLPRTPLPSATGLTLAQAPAPQVDLDRKRLMREAWKAYRGEFADALVVSAGQPNDNVKSNRCAPIVDKGVSFLFGKTLKIEVGLPSTMPTPREDAAAMAQKPASPEAEIQARQEYLNGVWGDDDEKMTLLSKAAINGGVCGHTFLKLIPPQDQMRYPRLVALDPQLVRFVTDPDDCDLILAFIIEYPTANDWQKRQIIARVDPDGLAAVAGEYDLDDTWTICTYLRRAPATAQQMPWQLIKQEDWPYPFPPVFHCQNLPNPNETWGKPDLTPDLIDMNRAINFGQSNTNRIIRFHAHPKTWGKGFRSTQMRTNIDDVIVIESENGMLQNLEMKSDLSSSLNYLAMLRADMDEQSRVPAVALGRQAELPKGNLSGVALQLLFQPIIEKTTQKQRLYGRMIREVSRAALLIGGLISLEEYEAYPITVHWPNLLPVDDLSAAQTAQILLGIGVSETTLMQQLGYDPEDEAQKSAVEATRKMAAVTQGTALPPPMSMTTPGLTAVSGTADTPAGGQS